MDSDIWLTKVRRLTIDNTILFLDREEGPHIVTQRRYLYESRVSTWEDPWRKEYTRKLQHKNTDGSSLSRPRRTVTTIDDPLCLLKEMTRRQDPSWRSVHTLETRLSEIKSRFFMLTRRLEWSGVRWASKWIKGLLIPWTIHDSYEFTYSVSRKGDLWVSNRLSIHFLRTSFPVIICSF